MQHLHVSANLTAAEARTRDKLLDRLVSSEFASRLRSKDAQLFGADAADEARIRMNWVDAPSHAAQVIQQASVLQREMLRGSAPSVLLCGMGGSSLGPKMLSQSRSGSLTVVDTTFPDDVSLALERIDTALIIASSKSGTTVETLSHLAAIEERLASLGIPAQERILVITDPGTDLAHAAELAGYRCVFADPHVGGRYSVLSAFGLVPAILAGVDVRPMVEEASVASATLFSDAADNPALVLAASILARGKPVYLQDAAGELGLSAWIEQLVAESTGKAGVGVLPVVLDRSSEDHDQRHIYGNLQLDGPLGAKLLCWEVATAAMGWLLGVNPFDQPDVERSKQAARELLTGDHPNFASSLDAEVLPAAAALQHVARAVQPGGYLSVQFFGAEELSPKIHDLRSILERALNVPVTFGFGPAYLHSTGQLHKGGPAIGAFLQIVQSWSQDLAIPKQKYTFGDLITAQARGDAEVLRAQGRSVTRTSSSLDELIAEATTLL